jgi:hypothetical protein
MRSTCVRIRLQRGYIVGRQARKTTSVRCAHGASMRASVGSVARSLWQLRTTHLCACDPLPQHTRARIIRELSAHRPRSTPSTCRPYTPHARLMHASCTPPALVIHARCARHARDKCAHHMRASYACIIIRVMNASRMRHECECVMLATCSITII